MKQDITSKTRERGVGKGESKPLNNLMEREGEKKQPGEENTSKTTSLSSEGGPPSFEEYLCQ